MFLVQYIQSPGFILVTSPIVTPPGFGGGVNIDGKIMLGTLVELSIIEISTSAVSPEVGLISPFG